MKPKHRYTAVLDEHTCEACRCLDGAIFVGTDPAASHKNLATALNTLAPCENEKKKINRGCRCRFKKLDSMPYFGKHESQIVGAMKIYASLVNALTTAGGSIEWEELETMTVPELLKRLGTNGIRFVWWHHSTMRE